MKSLHWQKNNEFHVFAYAADLTFEMLMGTEVSPRRRFILTHASAVRNLDI